MDLSVLKWLTAGLLFVVAMAGVFAARYLAEISQKWVHLANAFTGGVLIAVSLVHVLGDSTETLEPWGRKMNAALGGGCEARPCSEEGTEPFPVGLALAGAGFFLILAVGQLVGSHPHEEGHGHVEAGWRKEARASTCELGEAAPTASLRAQRWEGERPHPTLLTDSSPRAARAPAPRSSSEPRAAAPPAGATEAPEDCYWAAPRGLTLALGSEHQVPSSRSVGIRSARLGRTDGAQHAVREGGAGVAGFGTLVGLSVHAFIEGVATGSVATVQHLLMIAGAIIVHKAFTSFAVGTSLLGLHRSSPRTWWALGAFFSTTCSCGVTTGMALGQVLGGPASAALQCVASGTLLAVGIDDMIMPALKDETWRSRSILAAIVAYSLVSLLGVWV